MRDCKQCGRPAAEHPYIMMNYGMDKLWLSGPFAPWGYRLCNWITRTSCFSPKLTRGSTQDIAAKMVAEIESARHNGDQEL
jgi:hypothetical protein